MARLDRCVKVLQLRLAQLRVEVADVLKVSGEGEELGKEFVISKFSSFSVLYVKLQVGLRFVRSEFAERFCFPRLKL